MTSFFSEIASSEVVLIFGVYTVVYWLYFAPRQYLGIRHVDEDLKSLQRWLRADKDAGRIKNDDSSSHIGLDDSAALLQHIQSSAEGTGEPDEAHSRLAERLGRENIAHLFRNDDGDFVLAPSTPETTHIHAFLKLSHAGRDYAIPVSPSEWLDSDWPVAISRVNGVYRPQVVGSNTNVASDQSVDGHIHMLQSLRASRYTSPLVCDAVTVIRASFPNGNYKSFDVTLVQSYGDYITEAARARNMAGVFVLLGLGITMFRLNEVVHQIADIAGKSSTEAEQFLLKMGVLMESVGGAFSASVVGLAFMVAALVYAFLRDRFVHQKVSAIERCFNSELIPSLSFIQERDLPHFTTPQILAKTQEHLAALDKTVQGLTSGMGQSLTNLSGSIDTMLQRFGSFDRRYSELDEVYRRMAKAASNLASSTQALERTSSILENPLREHQETSIRTLTVARDSLELQRAASAQLTVVLTAIQEERTTAAERVGILFAELEARERMHNELVRAELTQVASLAESIRPMVQASREIASENVGLLRSLAGVAKKAEGTAAAMDAITSRMRIQVSTPPSLFAWVYQILTGRKRLFAPHPGAHDIVLSSSHEKANTSGGSGGGKGRTTRR